MTEQWQELKETITELRDNNGTGIQQEVCKFLANLMELLEKQMQEATLEDTPQYTDAEIQKMQEMEQAEIQKAYELGKDEQQKTGRWIYDKNIENWRCSECGETPKTRGYCGSANFMEEHFKYCNHCGAKMTEVEE